MNIFVYQELYRQLISSKVSYFSSRTWRLFSFQPPVRLVQWIPCFYLCGCPKMCKSRLAFLFTNTNVPAGWRRYSRHQRWPPGLHPARLLQAGPTCERKKKPPIRGTRPLAWHVLGKGGSGLRWGWAKDDLPPNSRKEFKRFREPYLSPENGSRNTSWDASRGKRCFESSTIKLMRVVTLFKHYPRILDYNPRPLLTVNWWLHLYFHITLTWTRPAFYFVNSEWADYSWCEERCWALSRVHADCMLWKIRLDAKILGP